MTELPTPPTILAPFDSIVVALVHPSEDLLASLLPEEMALIAESTSKTRRATFAAGREAAHKALFQLETHYTPAPILRTETGAPIFPAHVRGSISHSDRLGCAAVSNNPKILGVGIDTEALNRKLSPRVIERISSEAERSTYATIDTEESNVWLRIFCAKEALFKACYQYIQRDFSFTDVDVIFNSANSAHAHAGPALRQRLLETCPKGTQLALDLREERGAIIIVAALYRI
jgi:4'-phosphopantetheinyl transferase EntD